MANNLAQRFLRDRSGLAAVEYVVLTTGMAMVIIGAVAASGTGVSNKFTAVSTGMGNSAVANAVDEPVDAEPIAVPVSRPIRRPISMPIAVTPIAAD